MTDDPTPPQRRFAVELVQRLRDAGYQALWAGGCVRDELLGIPPKDFDIATSATPEQVRELFGRRKTIPVGAAFGVISVRGSRGTGSVEVATFRSDGPYSDGRRPDEVVYSTPEHDAQRRDFTINGLFFDPLTEEVIDFVGGRADLEQRVIRAIGDPEARIHEDKLRMLRAVRFAATYGFTIEPGTFTAVCRHAGDIVRVAPERIAAELRRMLTHSSRDRAFELLLDTGLLRAFLPPLEPLAHSLREPTAALLRALREPSFSVAWSALLSRLEPSAKQLRAWGKALRLSNEEIEGSLWLLAALPVVNSAPGARWSQLQPILVHRRIEELLTLLAAEVEVRGGAGNESLRYCREQLAQPPELLNPPPLLTGNDLLAHGVPRGPLYRELLEAVRTAQLEGEIADRAAALALVDRLRGAA